MSKQKWRRWARIATDDFGVARALALIGAQSTLYEKHEWYEERAPDPMWIVNHPMREPAPVALHRATVYRYCQDIDAIWEKLHAQDAQRTARRGAKTPRAAPG